MWLEQVGVQTGMPSCNPVAAAAGHMPELYHAKSIPVLYGRCIRGDGLFYFFYQVIHMFPVQGLENICVLRFHDFFI